jgi:hypothetical protein
VTQFEVTETPGGWFEAECRELGVLITAKKLAEVEATARRTAARVKKEAAFTYKRRPSLMERLRRWFSGSASRKQPR